jgi:hypothetical protein
MDIVMKIILVLPHNKYGSIITIVHTMEVEQNDLNTCHWQVSGI